jgi:uncharacterized membrane protein
MSLNAREIYVSDLRARYRSVQNAGYVACLIGVLVMLSGRFMAGAPSWLVFPGLAVILVGWALLAFAIFSRAAYMRAHPFDPRD